MYRRTNVLTGVPQATIQAWLSDAQNAYNNLMLGVKEVSVSYEGKSVSYRVADGPGLLIWIGQLQVALGMRGARRRPMVPFFR